MDLARFAGPRAGAGWKAKQAQAPGQVEDPVAAGAVFGNFYASPNGGRRRLVRDGASGREVVRHEANSASGGHVTELEADAFLGQGSTGPEHAALRRLLGGREQESSPRGNPRTADGSRA